MLLTYVSILCVWGGWMGRPLRTWCGLSARSIPRRRPPTTRCCLLSWKRSAGFRPRRKACSTPLRQRIRRCVRRSCAALSSLCRCLCRRAWPTCCSVRSRAVQGCSRHPRPRLRAAGALVAPVGAGVAFVSPFKCSGFATIGVLFLFRRYRGCSLVRLLCSSGLPGERSRRKVSFSRNSLPKGLWCSSLNFPPFPLAVAFWLVSSPCTSCNSQSL